MLKVMRVQFNKVHWLEVGKYIMGGLAVGLEPTVLLAAGKQSPTYLPLAGCPPTWPSQHCSASQSRGGRSWRVSPGLMRFWISCCSDGSHIWGHLSGSAACDSPVCLCFWRILNRNHIWMTLHGSSCDDESKTHDTLKTYSPLSHSDIWPERL